jgi:hypothetical protein
MTFLDDLSKLPDYKKPEKLNLENVYRQVDDEHEAFMRRLYEEA